MKPRTIGQERKMKMNHYLKETRLLDYSHPTIEQLLIQRQWDALSDYDKIGAVYDFVQNKILFGYNESDDIPASKVLNDGYGQCNTKGTLLMALLRRVDIPCRFHGFTIDRLLQKGAIKGLVYKLAPREIIHSWVEIYYEGKWINLEGFILDLQYLDELRKAFSDVAGRFCGYGVATSDFQNPPVKWQGEDTYIQKDGINKDYGIFDSPDAFYEKHGTNLLGLKKILYKYLIRKMINSNVMKIRNGISIPKHAEIP